MTKAVIKSVKEGSVAKECEIESGDILLEINGQKVTDILDYRFLVCEEELLIKIEKKNGDIEEIEIEKDAYEDLGIEFECGLISPPKCCANKCIFCFIDQNPKGMRESIYFKDDDTRMSFFQGNYITLTNLSKKDIDRIIKMRISPVNISVHTTNPNLRIKMLSNKRAGEIYSVMKRLAQNFIEMNAQIVLCPGYNDKKELEKTIDDLYKLYPQVKSVAVVPLGLTKHREGLCKLTPITKKDALDCLEIVGKKQKRFLKEHFTRFVYASDEFYLKAEKELPDSSFYEEYPQLENGVGLLSLLKDEFYKALEKMPKSDITHSIAVITGEAAYPTIKEIASALEKKFCGVKVSVYKIKNNFYGDTVTVSGLLCGCDITEQLKDVIKEKEALISKSMLKSNTNLFLDDYTTNRVEEELKIRIIPTENDGERLLKALLKMEETK